jgi:hypothetical protein
MPPPTQSPTLGLPPATAGLLVLCVALLSFGECPHDPCCRRRPPKERAEERNSCESPHEPLAMEAPDGETSENMARVQPEHYLFTYLFIEANKYEASVVIRSNPIKMKHIYDEILTKR